MKKTKTQLEREATVAREHFVRLALAAHNVLMADDLNNYPLPASIVHALKGLRNAYEKAKGNETVTQT